MSLVVNFDLPEEPETYVHRIGRTARAEASGQAVSFCTPDDVALLSQIRRYIKKDIPVYSENPYAIEPPKPIGNFRPQRRGGASRQHGGQGGSRGNGGRGNARGGASKNGGNHRGGRQASRPDGQASRAKQGGADSKRGASAERKPSPASSKAKGFFGFMKFGRKG